VIKQDIKRLELVAEAKRPKRKPRCRIRIHYIFTDVAGKVIKVEDNPATPCPKGMSEDVLNIHVVDTPHTARPVEALSDAEAEAELAKLEAWAKRAKGKR